MLKISDSINPHSLPSTALQCLWALDQLESKDKNRFSYIEVKNFLVERTKISIKRSTVQKALERAGTFVDKNKKGFLLMEKGRKELSSADVDEAFFIEAGKPFSAKRFQLRKIFSRLKGVLKVCDPYVDSDTLYTMFRIIKKDTPVRILTQKIYDKPVGSIKRMLADLKKEGFNIEIRVYNSSDLHDRYILDETSMWLSGNSLNHLGDKESFIVRLGKDLYQSTCALFDSRWKTSKTII